MVTSAIWEKHARVSFYVYILLYKSNKILARVEMDPLFVVSRVKMKTFLIFLNVTRTT
jgi:hypothetical protein